MSQQYELQNFSNIGVMGESKKSGTRISLGTGFVLILLAIVAAVGVGLIVHFAENRKLEYTGPEVHVDGNGGGQTGQQHGPGAGLHVSTLKPGLATEHNTEVRPSTTTSTLHTRDMRLPRSFSPFHYDLKLKPNIYTGNPATFTFSGSVTIHMRSLMPSTNVTLNLRDLNITSGTLAFSSMARSAISPAVVSHSFDKDLDFLIVHLDKETTRGQDYSLRMDFEGPLLDDLSGLYYSSYKQGNETVYLAATQFESLKARKAFPCFDEPSLKATFKVTLTRKNNLVSLSNMPIVNKLQKGEFIDDVYQTTRKMSTYLLAFIVADFKEVSMKVPDSDVTFGVWFRPEMAGKTNYALEIGAQTTAYYNKFFNISFPLPKQDMVALPDFRPGAMENWGLVTYREARVLYEKGESSEDHKETTVTYITHELGHQWFGDLVTMEWWNDIWLNEGFATFMEYLGADKLYPDWKMFDQFVVRAVHTVFDLDSYVTSHPLSSSVITADDLSDVFDRVAYNKGATLIRMVRFFIGEDTFQKGLQRYLSAHQYANANHNDLWRALTQQSMMDKNNINVTSIMESWTVQANYPVVTVLATKGKLHVSQQRFLKNRSARNNADSTRYTWNIPFTFTTEAISGFEITRGNITWLTAQMEVLDVPTLKGSDWVIANIQQYGYFRVNYADSNWIALIKQLKTAHKVLPVINRAQIIDDAWGLARAGLLSTNIALQTLEYLHKEMDLIPWMAARKQIEYLETMFRRSSFYGQFKSFMQSKLMGPFKQLGMDNSNASHVESLTRSLITELACKYGVPECLQESQRLFEEWMTKPDSNPIDPNLRPAVYCSAIAEGNNRQWEFAFEQLQKTSTAAERSLLLTSLKCTRATWLISRFLQLTITPSIIRKQDAVTLLIQMSKSSVGQLLVWNFIRENWNYLYNDYGKGAFAFAGLIDGVTQSFNTDFQLEQLQVFHDTHDGLDIAVAVFDRLVDGIASNTLWVKDNHDAVSDWLSTLSNDQSKRLTDVRLPTHLRPTMYDVTLKPNIYSREPDKFTFDGYVKIYLTAKETGRNVTLHVNKLNILDDTVMFQTEDSSPGPSYIANSMLADQERQFRVFFLDAPVVAGQNYTIEMNFTGPLKNDLVGLYYSQYKRQNETIYMATTQFEPTDARKAFPCFDEPQLKAKYNVKLIRKSSMKSLSNMPIMHSISIRDDFVVDVYQTSVKMSSYLLAFIVCDFEYTEGTTQRGVKYRAWARPESVNQTRLALDTGVKVLSHYEDYFNISFPLPKQEMIAIPDFAAGAMENWGLITYRETSMLYEEGVSSKSNEQGVRTTIAHELAHQWFGDLVTMEWWEDLWLNEGFATFVEYLGVDFVSPELKMFDQFAFALQSVFEIDSLVTSHPVFVPVKNPDEINEIFDTISYEKGASVIRMMRFFLGEETFRKGVSIYLTNRQYNNADHDDLWEGLQTQADREKKPIRVRDVMDTWIKQMNYPLVTVGKSANGKIQLKQERFLSDRLAEDPEKYVSPFNYVWKIPFTCTKQDNANFRPTDRDVTWLNAETLELDETYPSQGWIIGNIGQFGVYRVQYEEDNWRLLVQQLTTDHKAISLLNRAQIINDAFGLAKAKQLSMFVALSTVQYLDKEQEYVPWRTAAGELDFVDSMLAETEAYGDFQEFMKRKVEEQYTRLGITDDESSPMESYLRRTITSYACNYGNQACINASKSLFIKYMSTPTNNPISPVLKNSVYCTAIRFGGEREWQFLYNQYIHTTVPAEKSGIFSALSCTRNIWIINKLLQMAMDESIVRAQDGYYVLSYLSSHPVGRAVAWDFFRSHFDLLFERYGRGTFAMKTIIRGITGSFNTEFRLQQLKDFQKLHPDMGTGTAAYAQAIEKTATNIRWMSDYYDTVSHWLTTQRAA